MAMEVVSAIESCETIFVSFLFFCSVLSVAWYFVSIYRKKV